MKNFVLLGITVGLVLGSQAYASQQTEHVWQFLSAGQGNMRIVCQFQNGHFTGVVCIPPKGDLRTDVQFDLRKGTIRRGTFMLPVDSFFTSCSICIDRGVLRDGQSLNWNLDEGGTPGVGEDTLTCRSVRAIQVFSRTRPGIQCEYRGIHHRQGFALSDVGSLKTWSYQF
jgi:hypothetical protein